MDYTSIKAAKDRMLKIPGLAAALNPWFKSLSAPPPVGLEHEFEHYIVLEQMQRRGGYDDASYLAWVTTAHSLADMHFVPSGRH